MTTVPARVFRRLVVWCPDWPVMAASQTMNTSALAPAAVFDANRVLACSAAARDQGIQRGMRRREAQGRCPELVVSEHDLDRDARMFEPVAAALESVAPGVEVVRPGLAAVPVQGPARYFGSEEVVAERVVDRVATLAGAECQTGAADGLFTAILAARRGVLVESGHSKEFLEPLPIDEIDQPAQETGTSRADLVHVLRRLGIRTLGAFAALPAADVLTRFGTDALLAHRAASGVEERPPDRRQPPPELEVVEQLDPPVEQVDAAAFVAKALSGQLHQRLAKLGLGCTRLGISARTEHGEQLHRVWRCAEPLTPSGTADRVRWQLDGWLTGQRGPRPTAGVSLLSLFPEEIVSAGGLQLDLVHSATGEADSRAGRAFVRVQGMLGPEAVVTGVIGGGRDLRDQVTFVPWGDEPRPALNPSPPWPGRIPAPSPSVVPDSPWPVVMLDQREQPVRITDRHVLTTVPHTVRVEGGRQRRVVAWAGPWPLEERWWAAAGKTPARRVARMQLVLEGDPATDQGEVALLVMYEADRWWVQGGYR